MNAAVVPPAVFRLGRKPDPWAWPDWAYAEADGTFGNRYDDPMGVYRMLYAATQRLATFVECLAYFRPDLALTAELCAIVAEDDDDEPQQAGVVPHEWLANRCVGSGQLIGDYVDIGHHETLAELRAALGARVVHYGIRELDAAAIRLTVPRAFTQELSRYVFEQSQQGERRWNGIAYRSRHGDDLENWAIFEPTGPRSQTSEELDVDDGDLRAALALHGLALG